MFGLKSALQEAFFTVFGVGFKRWGRSENGKMLREIKTSSHAYIAVSPRKFHPRVHAVGDEPMTLGMLLSLFTINL